MYEVIRNEYEQEAIRFLTDRYVNGGDWVNVREFPRYEELGEQDIQRVVARFVNFGLLGWQTTDSLDIDVKVVEIADQIDNSPPKDYWKDLIAWFRSKPWSILVFALLVCLPLLVQWVEMIKTLLEWLEVVE